MKSWMILFVLVLAPLLACHKKKAETPPPPPVTCIPGTPEPVATEDEGRKERTRFRNATRALYNDRKFDELEKLAGELRTSKALFKNGSWRLFQFYDCLGCSKQEPESMWELHDKIHKEWLDAYPDSITANVAYADFWVEYAWHARGSGYAHTVSPNGWRLFAERLAKAREVLDSSEYLRPQCPMWWKVRMNVALGQGWSPIEFHKLFEEAKAFEPAFWGYDSAQAYFLLPRWHGAEGEWEYVAESEAKRPGSIGSEGYARVVMCQSGFYDNIFKESNASWLLTRTGCEQLRRKYPSSLEILSNYCILACSAQDRPLARKLFTEINGRMDRSAWSSRDHFIKMQNWAFGQ